MDRTVIGNYKVIKKLGRGSFGTVYEVEDESRTRYALKMENVPKKTTSQLSNEYVIYNSLKGCKGIARVHFFGMADNYYYLVMDRLGPSLQDLYERRKKNFSLKTVCMIGIAVLESLEDIHGRSRIFRDIKPENILIGHGNPDDLFLIDLGMAKCYIDPKTGNHIPFIDEKKLTGTARYASLNTHMGYEQSRRDDLESLGYTLIYFLKGCLPWMGVHAKTGKEKHTVIGEMKRTVSFDALCDGLPGKTCFINYLEYVRGLGFTERPNYKYLIKLFKHELRLNKLKNDKNYDWITQEYHEQRMKKRKSTWWSKFKSFIDVCKSRH